MKQFTPTYLYIKTHNITKLKYFGKTTQNPMEYRGSGKYWLRHIKNCGYDVTTEILGFYECKEDCMRAALEFSKLYNIVESDEWANLVEENGIDGGATSFGPRSEETKNKISEAHIGKTHSQDTKDKIKKKRQQQDMSHMKVPKSEEHRKKISESLKGRIQSEETKRKRADKLKGKPRSEETKKKISESQKGKIIPEEVRAKMSISAANAMTEERKQHLSELNKGRIWSEEEKQKLKGKIVVVNREGVLIKISVQEYSNQVGDDWEYVHFRSKEGIKRRINAVPVFKQEDAEDLTKMRR